MICPICGRETPDNSPKCTRCGMNLNALLNRQSEQPRDSTPEPVDSAPETAAQEPPTPIPYQTPSNTLIDLGGATMVTPATQMDTPPVESTSISSQYTPPETTGRGTIDDEEEMLRSALSGRYEVIRKLGAGGMANVYLAREIALDREVAIKLLPKSMLRDETFITRFTREAQVAANLEHPNIVRIYRISEEADLCYFVMSFIPRGSLSDQIKKRGAIPVEEIVKWGTETCSALAHAHEHGVIHRDLKPDNIMLDKNNGAIVMDFGIARASQGTGLTQTGAVIGTPQFMSPEQARGLELDARSDLYSFGLVLYQLATGSLPFEASDPATLMYKHVHEAPEAPDVRNAKVPPWLRDIILKCLAKDPENRFDNASDLRTSLTEHIAPVIDPTILMAKEKYGKKSKTGLFIGIGAIVIAIVAAAVIWQQTQQKKFEQAEREIAVRIQEQQTPAKPAVSQDNIAYQQAEMINTLQAYSTYLEKFPEGDHSFEAGNKISDFNELEAARLMESAANDEERERLSQERAEQQKLDDQRRQAQEAARADNSAFQQAVMINSRQAYDTYIATYPDGRHIAEARGKIAALDSAEAVQQQAVAAEVAKRDNEAYQIAMNANNEQSLSTYLISFPDGLHSTEVKERLDAIESQGAFEKELNLALSNYSIVMAPIPGGSFPMGSNEGDDDEKPVRTVTVSGFTMSTTEITQGQYQAIVANNPAFFKLDDNAPVERVSWMDALKYCNLLSQKLNLEPCYDLASGACDFTKNGFRLPTEAEWEYACRANRGSEYNIGDGESALNRAGWYVSNSGEQSHPVAQKTENPFGLYDMHGNVWEWCYDSYAKDSYAQSTNDNPTGIASGRDRVLRGGGWLDWPQDCRTAKRRNYRSDRNYSDIGFRIVRR